MAKGIDGPWDGACGMKARGWGLDMPNKQQLHCQCLLVVGPTRVWGRDEGIAFESTYIQSMTNPWHLQQSLRCFTRYIYKPHPCLNTSLNIKSEVSLIEAQCTVDVIPLWSIKVGKKFPSSIPSYCNLHFRASPLVPGSASASRIEKWPPSKM